MKVSVSDWEGVESSMMNEEKNSKKPLIRTIEITMPCHLGFHLRVISRFIVHAKRFQAKIRVRKGKIVADGKNIIGLLLLAAAWKSKLYIEAEGNDAEEAIARIKSFFQTEESTGQ